MPRTVVITGASRGVGLQLVRNFAAAGDTVIARARDPATADALNALAAANSAARVLPLDVADAAQVSAFEDTLAGQLVDILINNAGAYGSPHQALGDMDFDAWREVLEINTIAPFRLASALLPNLLKSDQPKIVTVTSQMGAFANGGASFAYQSSKCAANKVMQMMAQELKPRGVIACPMHPGWVQSDMGGPGAEITVEQSARGIFDVTNHLTMADTGKFWRWDGKLHPW